MSKSSPASVLPALARFRVMAAVTGCALFILVIIMVYRYILHGENGAEISNKWSPIHGLIYILYLVTCYDLWSRMRWGVKRLVVLALYGVVPVLSFFGERRTSLMVHEELAASEAQKGGAA
ncbi:DUF3817 domain-containing protein [Micrococcales bacterium 31B]|nr:DUF3817 domain-containing protein [Micrococcales bacterium 31B]